MELKNVIGILHRSWVLILACTLFAGAGAAAFSFTATPTYVANTQLYVSVQPGAESGASDLLQGTSFVRQAVASYVLVVTSPVVLNDVIDELGLDVTASELASDVVASAPLNTAVIDVAVTSDDPVLAAQIANSVGENFSRIVVSELEKPQGALPSPVQIETIGPALVPPGPASPNIPLNIALGVLVGLGLGVALAVLRSVLDNRIRGVKDVESLTEAPVLGGITLDPDAKAHPLIVHSDARNPRAESFRSLRTNLRYVNVEGGPRSFVITSSIPGEGKSTTSANLAIAMAANGSRVALIDADLRLSRLAEYMGLEGGAGLTDVLIGRADLDDVLQKWGPDDLYVLGSGRVPPNPSELLGSAPMERVLAALTERFDIVLIDSPPLLAVTDAAVLSNLCGGALLVVASGKTTKHEVSSAVRALERVGSRMVGVVVTMLPAKGPGSYRYGQYGADVPVENDPAVAKAAGPRRAALRTRLGRA